MKLRKKQKNEKEEAQQDKQNMYLNNDKILNIKIFQNMFILSDDYNMF